MSGVVTLPMVVGLAVSILVAGYLTTLIGYFTPVLLVGSALLTVGAGLMTTFSPQTGMAKWAAFQVLYGLGCGLSWQAPYVAVQTVVNSEDITSALCLLTFAFVLGGILALAVAQSVVAITLAGELQNIIPGLTPKLVAQSGAFDFIRQSGPEDRAAILLAYSNGIRPAFYLTLGLGCAAFIFALGIKITPVKSKSLTSDDDNMVSGPNDTTEEKAV